MDEAKLKAAGELYYTPTLGRVHEETCKLAPQGLGDLCASSPPSVADLDSGMVRASLGWRFETRTATGRASASCELIDSPQRRFRPVPRQQTNDFMLFW